MQPTITFDMLNAAISAERRFQEFVRILKYESRFVFHEPYKCS